MKTDELREKYLAFFQSKGHTLCPSDVLVPTWDPSVLFTPAGMNQFKDHFLGKVKLDFTRATTAQKCLRTGDIDNVGRTAYHHTFFEMMGNFSFGDYFKRDAINWAWEFLTDKKWLAIDPDRLTVTVYLDDDEAAGIWANDVGLSNDRIERMGEHDNFWPAGAPSGGPDGVCGPCSEIFFHPDVGSEVEIWNLVFTQFNRVGNPPDNLRPLPSKNIDTGMGLERTAAVLQGVDTNYHIDILRPIVEAAAVICSTKYVPENENGRRLRRITDHVRACSFAIHENVYPGNKAEKYVIKRLLRRAVLDGHQMGQRTPFLYQLVPAVVDMMRSAYPELDQTSERVQQVIRQEEEAFLSTLDHGLDRVEAIFSDLDSSKQMMVTGADAADLYQTYGIPPELVESMAATRKLTFDWDGFRQAMEEHGGRSNPNQIELFKTGPIESAKRTIKSVEFLGYQEEVSEAQLKKIVVCGLGDNEDEAAEQIKAGDGQVILILDRSPFYAESGGQVGDSGEITAADGARFVVEDTKKDADLILHLGRLAAGELRAGETVSAAVDSSRRQAIRRAHSATHILHHALQEHLGSHAQQQGSKVDEDWLRFDFSNMSGVSSEQLVAIENDVSQRVQESAAVDWKLVPLAEARSAGAMMLFGEKYPDPVRMVSMGDFSKELCGGTHISNTSEVGEFEIISEEGVSAGTRRVTALTGERARRHAEQTAATLDRTATILDVANHQVPEAARQLSAGVRALKKSLSGSGGEPPETSLPREADQALDYQATRHCLREAARALNIAPLELPERIQALQDEVAQLTKQLAQLESSGTLSADGLLADATEINGTTVIVRDVPGANPNLMRQLIDQTRKKKSPVAILLATAQGDNKVMLIAGVSRDLVEQGVKAGDWVREVAPVVGGGGGGKPDMAQAGGKDPSKLPAALEKATATITAMLG